MSANQTQTQKQVISVVEFEKKVQIEMEHLIYMDRMKPAEAQRQASAYVNSKFQVS